MTDIRRKPISFGLLFSLDGEEREKVFSLLLLKGLVSFVFVIIRTLKKPLIVAADGGSAEASAVIKGVVVLPSSILVVMLYTYLSFRYTLASIFYGFLVTYFSFFLLYVLVLLPLDGVICPHAYTEQLAETYPHYRHWIALIRLWPHVIFFFMAEIWGQMAIFVFFWNIASQLCGADAKRYFHYYIGSGCVAGLMVLLFTTWLTKRFNGDGDFVRVQLPVLMVLAMVTLVAILVLFSWMAGRFDLKKTIGGDRKRPKLTLREGIAYILGRPYLLGVTVIMLGCAISMSLVDITHDTYVKIFSKGKRENFLQFTSYEGIIVHVVAIIACFFISPYIIEWFGWRFLLYVAPCVILVWGSFFFGMSYFRHSIDFPMRWWGISSELFVIYLGASFSIIAKAVKYVAFDNAKEVIYSRMDAAERNRSKASVDLLGSRGGKSLSSYFHLFSLWVFQTDDVRVATPLLLFFFWVICAGWLKGVFYIAEIKDDNKATT